jgi:hypothetical protein
MLLVDHKDILLERDNDVLVRAKLEIISNDVGLIFTDTVIVKLSSLDALKVPYTRRVSLAAFTRERKTLTGDHERTS